jgi:hypothetical protein
VLGIKVAASTAWDILKEAGIDPAPERSSSTWADFLRSQADALLACDFFETVTLSGARMYVFAVIEHANRRIRILGATAHPTAAWVTQAGKNLVIANATPSPTLRSPASSPDGAGPWHPSTTANAPRACGCPKLGHPTRPANIRGSLHQVGHV